MRQAVINSPISCLVYPYHLILLTLQKVSIPKWKDISQNIPKWFEKDSIQFKYKYR